MLLVQVKTTCTLNFLYTWTFSAPEAFNFLLSGQLSTLVIIKLFIWCCALYQYLVGSRQYFDLAPQYYYFRSLSHIRDVGPAQTETVCVDLLSMSHCPGIHMMMSPSTILRMITVPTVCKTL